MKNGLNTYAMLQMIQNAFVTLAAECGSYASSWGKDYIVERVSSLYKNEDRFRKDDKCFDIEFTQIDFQTLTAEQLLAVGFRRWDNEFSFLIPLYLMNFLKIDESYKCINGGFAMVEHFDNDHRYGCLAYYFNLVN